METANIVIVFYTKNSKAIPAYFAKIMIFIIKIII